jgi:hypothetical protein
VANLLFSLSRNTRPPDLVTVVSNEVDSSVLTFGLPVRVIRFQSAHYPVGDCDAALRRDIGFWHATCPYQVGLDDDELAPPDLCSSALAILGRARYFFGNYRFVPFAERPAEEILALPPQLGGPRDPPNTWHSWKRCWGGIFGVRRGLVQAVGGFDLIFIGAHDGEDIGFGKRLAKRLDLLQRIFVYDPPFVWHPLEEVPWSPAVYSNLCHGAHDLARDQIRGLGLSRCRRCPYHRADDHWKLFADEVYIPFDPSLVELTVEELAKPS